MFSYEYCEIFKNSFFIEHLRWLLSTYYKVRTTYENVSHDSLLTSFGLFSSIFMFQNIRFHLLLKRLQPKSLKHVLKSSFLVC